MKQALIASIAALTLTACTQEHYTVTMLLPQEAEVTTGYLTNYDTGDTLNTAQVVDNKLIFEGDIKEPVIARLVFDDGTKTTLVLEAGNAEITTQPEVAVKGGAMNTLFKTAIETPEDEIYAALQALMADTTKTREEKTIEGMKLQDNMYTLYSDVYNANKNNCVGFYAFMQLAYTYDKHQLDSVLVDAPAQVLNSRRVKKILQGFENLEKTAEGKMFTDFTITAADGSKASLSDYVGKGDIVLVDFWASWCGPCIRETAVIKKINEQYSDKGLKVLGVAVWDDPDNTAKAIAKHSIPWPQIVGAQAIPTDLYGINGIPHIIIFDGDGTILSRGLQGSDLVEKVKEIMERNK